MWIKFVEGTFLIASWKTAYQLKFTHVIQVHWNSQIAISGVNNLNSMTILWLVRFDDFDLTSMDPL